MPLIGAIVTDRGPLQQRAEANVFRSKHEILGWTSSCEPPEPMLDLPVLPRSQLAAKRDFQAKREPVYSRIRHQPRPYCYHSQRVRHSPTEDLVEFGLIFGRQQMLRHIILRLSSTITPPITPRWTSMVLLRPYRNDRLIVDTSVPQIISGCVHPASFGSAIVSQFLV